MKKLFVLIMAIALVGAFTLPAMAADWNFYGNSRFKTFTMTESDYGDEEADTDWTQQSNSRIGAKVKNGDISGRFEYGTGVNLRQLYATWNFGAGNLLIGQTYTPITIFTGSQVYGSDNSALNYGGVYGLRRPMIQVQLNSFKIALVRPETNALGAGTIRKTAPKIEAEYKYKADTFFVEVVGGYQSYIVDTAGGDEVDVNSMVYAVGGGVNFGPAYVKADIMGGKNIGPYGIFTTDYGTSAMPTITGDDLNDNDTIGYLGVVGFKANDKLKFEAGYGFVSHELDVSGADADETTCFYAQANITITPGFFIVPEFGVIDYEDDAEDGSDTYFGAKWQINF